MAKIKYSQVYQKIPKQGKVFYKTLCLDCNNIVSIEWQKPYINYENTIIEQRPMILLSVCPLCDSQRLHISKINQATYTQLSDTWDLLDSQVNSAENSDFDEEFWINNQFDIE